MIKTNTGQHITLKPGSIEIGVDDQNTTAIKLDATSITLKAANITLGDGSSIINIG